jgi:hypothetical protein
MPEKVRSTAEPEIYVAPYFPRSWNTPLQIGRKSTMRRPFVLFVFSELRATPGVIIRLMRPDEEVIERWRGSAAALSRPVAFLCYMSNPRRRLLHGRARAWRVARYNPPPRCPAYYRARMTRGSECRQIREHWRSRPLHP